MSSIPGSNHTDVRFGSRTHRHRDKAIFKRRGDIEAMDAATLLRKLDCYSQPTSLEKLPRHLRQDWGSKQDILVARLHDIIKTLPSSAAARRLERRLKSLKHFSIDTSERISTALKKALKSELPQQSPWSDTRTDSLLDALGYDEPLKHDPKVQTLDHFHWGRPIETSTPDY